MCKKHPSKFWHTLRCVLWKGVLYNTPWCVIKDVSVYNNTLKCVLQHINGWEKIISKSIEVCQYINIFVQIKRPTVYIRLASLKSNNIYMHNITVWFIYANHFLKFKFQTLDNNEQLTSYRTRFTHYQIDFWSRCMQTNAEQEWVMMNSQIKHWLSLFLNPFPDFPPRGSPLTNKIIWH